MKFMHLAVAAVSAILVGSAAQAEVITFDDVGNFVGLGAGYHGLDWSNFVTINGPAYAPSGYKNGVVSPDNVACACAGDGSQAIDTISSATAFSLDSGYFTSAWNDGATLLVNGFLGGNLVDTTTAVLNTSGPSLLTFGWSNIDRVEFSISGGTPSGLPGGGNYFALDNLSVGPAGGVPEPAVWMMMIVGFGLAGASLRQRRMAVA